MSSAVSAASNKKIAVPVSQGLCDMRCQRFMLMGRPEDPAGLLMDVAVRVITVVLVLIALALFIWAFPY